MNQHVIDALRDGRIFLQNHGVEDALDSSEQLLSHVLLKTRSTLYADGDKPLSGEKENFFYELLAERSRRIPLQYLIGYVPFRYVDLKVRTGTFIPRPETEEVVDVAICRLEKQPAIKSQESVRILEIGTGSGNLAISLAAEIPNARIIATDCSSASLKLARLNARKNSVHSRIEFIQTWLWEKVSGKFDLLVSNPPYLSEEDLKEISEEVRHEPICALDGGKDGLRVISGLISRAHEVLKPFGLIVLEIGYGQAGAVLQLLRKNGFEDIQVNRDLAGIDRVVSAVLNSKGNTHEIP